MPYSNDDSDLMIKFINGDEQCFVELVNRHKQRVFNIAYRYLGNTHDAEEAAQQVFINIYNTRSYQPSAQFTTWLYTVCKNTCLKTHRKKRLSTLSMDEGLEFNGGSLSVQLSDTNSATPLQETINSERDEIVQEAINALPENQRLVIILYKYEELSYEKISEVTGLSAQAVKSLLHRARLNLKERLSGYFKN